MTDTRKLDVYLRDQYAGILEQDSQANLTFRYDEVYKVVRVLSNHLT